MSAPDAAAAGREPARDPASPTRFLLVADARTGSTMLVRALRSHPNVQCFGELFNTARDAILYGVDGYDRYNVSDRALRDSDFEAFLRERIYRPSGETIRAIGFKLLYGQERKFPGFSEWLAQDSSVRVAHLRRRNLLRQLVSLKRAQATGNWVDDRKSKLSIANAKMAARHPLRAAGFLGRRLRAPKAISTANPQARRPKVTVSREELFDFIVRTSMRAARYDDLLNGHPKLTLFYEDVLARRDEFFQQAQEFLGVSPASLSLSTRRQNPEPLRELIANYEELHEAYRDSPHADMFD